MLALVVCGLLLFCPELLQAFANLDNLYDFIANGNPAQSTHTASVHESATQSALKLKAKFGQQDYDAHIQAFLTILRQSSDQEPKTLAAIRGLSSIQTGGKYDYVDPKSNISIKELFGLLYVAIQDRDYCKSSFEDAKQLLIESLWEIQRGDNIDAQGRDDFTTPDSSICPPGAFNKLLNHFSGVLPDVEFKFINKEHAGYKLNAVVKEELTNYLHDENTPQDVKDAWTS